MQAVALALSWGLFVCDTNHAFPYFSRNLTNRGGWKKAFSSCIPVVCGEELCPDVSFQVFPFCSYSL